VRMSRAARLAWIYWLLSVALFAVGATLWSVFLTIPWSVLVLLNPEWVLRTPGANLLVIPLSASVNAIIIYRVLWLFADNRESQWQPPAVTLRPRGDEADRTDE